MDALESEFVPPGNFPLRRTARAAVLVIIGAAHALATVRTVAGDQPLSTAFDDKPIVSGRHPVHLYHASAGAAAFHDTGDCAGFDPNFAAGFARTPAVDFDSRPYELFLLGAPEGCECSRYKLALFFWWSVLPWGFWSAARLARYGGLTAVVAAALGALLAGSGPGKQLLVDGDLGQALSAALAALHLACLVRCHARPDLRGFFGLLITAIVGWCLQPLIWGGVGLLSFGCWLGMFRRHGVRWHSAYGLAQGVAALAALPWLAEWVRYWWLTMPVRPAVHGVRAWAIWDWPLWGDAGADRIVCVGLVACGFLGGLLRRPGRRARPIKWLLGSSLLAIAVAVAAPSTDALAPFAAPAFLFLGLSLAIVPAAHGIARWMEWQFCGAGRRRIGMIVGGTVFAGGALWLVGPAPTWAAISRWGPPRLTVGLPADLAALADVVRNDTTPNARVLWEECGGEGPSLSALLPCLTQRAILGGAGTINDADAAYANLVDGSLAGRPIALWTNSELESYCRRYNVGWIAAVNRSSQDRLDCWPLAEQVRAAGSRRLYSIRRSHSFILKGRAAEVTLDRQGIALADVVPENGDVVLSLHYHDGLRVRPGWVKLEREPDAYDPIPLVRLRMIAPAARVTLSWSRP